MTTRSAYPGTASPGDVYTAANHAKMPGGWVAFQSGSSSQITGISAYTAIAGVTLNLDSGRWYRVTVSIRWLPEHVDCTGMEVRLNPTGALLTAVPGIDDGLFLRQTYDDTGVAALNDTQFTAFIKPSSTGSITLDLEVKAEGGGSASIEVRGTDSYILLEDIGAE